MNFTTNRESNQTHFQKWLVKTSSLLGFLVLIIVQSQSYGQDNGFNKSSWWFGVAGGVNINLYHGSVQELNSAVKVPLSFNSYSGSGLFAFPIMEYHKEHAKLGFMLYTGYESRRGSFNQNLSTKLAYFTIEPSIRLNLFNSPLYIFSGPRFAINVDKRFSGGTIGNMKETVTSMQIGGGYDLSLTASSKKNQVIISPFVAFHPYFGQNPRTIESWNITTIRAGIAFKFGRARKEFSQEHEVIPVVIALDTESALAKITRQDFVPGDSIKEDLPLQNYVYFDLRPSKRTSPNELISKSDTELSLSGNILESSLQNAAYENILSVLGDRMINDPSASIKLIESSQQNSEEIPQMAESIKAYLVGVFNIAADRIITKNLKKSNRKIVKDSNNPRIALLLQGDRQVSIESNSSGLLMKFVNESNESLKSARIFAVHEAPTDSYVTFKTKDEKETYSFWSLEVNDPYGKMQKFGPFKQETLVLAEKSIIGSGPEGNYDITFIGQTIDGRTIKKETSAQLKLWTPPVFDEITRFSINYEFSNLKAIKLFRQFLASLVVPNIPKDGTVIIHGHTETLGGENYNLKMFLTSSNDTRKIIEEALAKNGRTDVNFEVHGFGEDQTVSFDQTNQEKKQFYNRTVFIDIIPAEK